MHRNTEDLKQWELPGGKLEKDELPEQTVVRELKEGDCILIPKGIKHYHANKSSKTIEQIYLFAPQGPEKPLRDLEIIK